MKKIGFFICGLFTLFAGSVKSAPITESDAKSVAEVFCAKKGITGDLSLSDVKRESCYIFNSSEDGYVIVAANDNLTPILGYSKTGAIHVDAQKVVAFIGWLNSIDAETDSLLAITDEQSMDKTNWSQLRSGEVPVSTRGAQSVDPLLTTKWSQYEPYNLLCPESSPTGCVAVAMAQIMKYYNYPKRGTGSTEAYATATNNYSIPSISLDVEYDWENMLDDYSGDFSQVEAEAVSKLLYHCGAAVYMDYDEVGSGASVRDAIKPLCGYFDYDRSMHFCERGHFTVEQWHSLLKEQLNSGYPIIYSGRNESATEGHSFVCDGYDENGFYHFNFGWGGYCDGYYMLDYILPVEEPTNDLVSNYSYSQTALINIFPNKSGSCYYDFINVVPEDFSISKDTITEEEIVEISNKIYNPAAESFDGELFMEIRDGDKNLLEIVSLTSVSIDAYAYITLKNMRMSYTLFPNGVYYLSFKLRDSDGKDYVIRDVNESVALRKFVVNIPQKDTSFNFVYEWSDYFNVSPDTVLQGEYLNVEACISNVSQATFKGSANLVVFNSAGDTVGVLESEIFEAGFLGGGCLYWEFPIDHSFAGNYYVEVHLRDETGKVYAVRDAENSDNKRKFFVKAPVVPETSQCDFVCKNSTDLKVVIESTNDTITSIAVNYQFFNESNFNFLGTVHFDLVEESGRVLGSVSSEELTISATESYQGALRIDLNCWPLGEYYVVIRLESADGDVYLVKDVNCETAKGIFTIGETIGYPLVFTQDNSLLVSYYNHQLNLYSDEKQIVVIYDLQGRVVKTISVEGSVHTDLKSGCYLIKSKNSAIKVVL